MEINIGDRFLIKDIPVSEHMKLANRHGGWNPVMKKWIGKEAVVYTNHNNLMVYPEAKVVRLKLNGSTFTWNLEAVTRVSDNYEIY